ncbi:MAG: lysin [Lactobacillaceae bacterium]|nr:lysin [Lactobacillaceae bacterium]
MKNKTKITLLFAAALLTIGVAGPAYAAKNDYGVDWSVYQGTQGQMGYGRDKFAIAQIGGYSGGIYDQSTYDTQVQYAIAQGKRAHTYIWWQGITDNGTADYVLNYFLPKVQTPKNSIVALDVESGAQNTDVILHAVQRIKDAGFTPMVYGYKNFLVNNTDLTRISNTVPLWLASYPNYEVTTEPYWPIFPSWDNVGLYQFTSSYVAGGLDGNIDLTGITDNGYTKNDNPKTDTPAIDAGKQADNTPKKDIDVGMTVKVNFSANNYATGESIPEFVKGVSHKVIQRDGDNVLLDGIYSWMNIHQVEILDANTQETVSFNGVYVVDKWFIYGGKWYARNNDMSVPVADYNNDIPVDSLTLTDRYGNPLANQVAQGNNGQMEYFTLNGKYKVLDRSGYSVKVEISGEPVWVESAYTN